MRAYESDGSLLGELIEKVFKENHNAVFVLVGPDLSGVGCQALPMTIYRLAAVFSPGCGAGR